MKKKILFLLICALILTLTGCKSMAVRAIDQKIQNLPPVSAHVYSGIAEIDKMLDELSPEELGQLEHYSEYKTYKAAYERESALETAAGLDAQFRALGEITLENGWALEDLKHEYDYASSQARAYMETEEELLKAWDTLIHLQAKDYDSQILSLGAMTLQKEEKLIELENRMPQLSEDARVLVKHHDKLISARDRLDTLKAQPAIQAINRIGYVTYNSDEKIFQASEAFANLPSHLQDKVTNYDKLEKAWEDLRIAKEKRLSSLLGSMNVSVDPFEGVTFYFPKPFPFYQDHWVCNQRSFLLPYFMEKDNTIQMYLICNFTAKEAIGLQGLSIAADDVHLKETFDTEKIKVQFFAPKMSENIGIGGENRVVEIVETILNSRKAYLRFHGTQENVDVPVNSQDRQVMKKAYETYRLLKDLGY